MCSFNYAYAMHLIKYLSYYYPALTGRVIIDCSILMFLNDFIQTYASLFVRNVAKLVLVI